MTAETFNKISSFFGLLPAIVGLVVFKRAGFSLRLFFFLMVYGAFTDISVWYLWENNADSLSRAIFYIYSPVEAIVFCILINRWSEDKKIKLASSVSIPFWILLWVLFHVNLGEMTWFDEPKYGLFVSIYEMVVAWLSGAVLLLMTRKNINLFKTPSFLILTGIFFYCFCTFSVNTLSLSKSFVHRFWYVHNTINILTSLIYSYGLFTIEPNEEISSSIKLD